MSDNDIGVNPTRMTSSGDKAMPQDLDAEKSVLSAMLVSEDVLQECLIELEPDDFSSSNRAIFEAMRALFDRGMTVDTVSLADYLKSEKKLDLVGGRGYLLDLGNNPLALAGWRRHVSILKRDTTLRRLIEASSKITALAYDAPEDTKEVVDQAEKLLLDVTDRDVRQNEESIDQVMQRLYDQLEEASRTDGANLGIQTGFKTIDRYLLGLRPGQMIVIGARPGVGKTSFALNLAVNAAYSGASVALFSLEMSKIEVAQRLLAAESQVGLQDIRSARIKKDQWNQIITATSELSELDIMIDDTPGTTVTEIRAKARRMLHGKKNGLVIIDYLQLISPPAGGRRADSRATEVSEMSRGIKIMAKDLSVPVVALSQLNRSVESRSDRRPQLSDLRESGSIEQDADIVALLDRTRATDDDSSTMSDMTNFIIAKNRSGPLGEVTLAFIPGSTKFVEVDDSHDE